MDGWTASPSSSISSPECCSSIGGQVSRVCDGLIHSKGFANATTSISRGPPPAITPQPHLSSAAHLTMAPCVPKNATALQTDFGAPKLSIRDSSARARD